MPEQGPYTYTAPASSQFERLGHPGKYITAYQYTGTQVDFTGSNYGYGAVMVVAANGATASLSEGGQIPLGDLTAGIIYDLSVSQIRGGTSSVIYVLKRQTGF